MISPENVKAGAERSDACQEERTREGCERGRDESDLEIDLMTLESIEYTIDAAYGDPPNPFASTFLPCIWAL
jgi:hypothetical protein